MPLIATISLNPSLDEHITVKRLVVEDVSRVQAFSKEPGGKGINVSRAIHELGGQTIALGLIGGCDGWHVRELLEREGVTTSFVTTSGETRTNVIITDASRGTQTKISHPGPQVRPLELETFHSFVAHLAHLSAPPAFLVMAGSLPPGIPSDYYARLIREAKGWGMKTALDTDGPPLSAGLEAKPDLIKPNLFEAQRLLGRDLKSESEIVAAGRELLGRGIETVVISCSRQGAFAFTGTDAWKGTAPQVTVVDTVGAGDSMLGAMVWRLSLGDPLNEALRWGLATGSAAVITSGTELCYRADVERLLEQAQVEPVS